MARRLRICVFQRLDPVDRSLDVHTNDPEVAVAAAAAAALGVPFEVVEALGAAGPEIFPAEEALLVFTPLPDVGAVWVVLGFKGEHVIAGGLRDVAMVVAQARAWLDSQERA